MNSKDQDLVRRETLRDLSRRLIVDGAFRESVEDHPALFVALPSDPMGYVFLMLGSMGVPSTMFVPTGDGLVGVRFVSAPKHVEPTGKQGVGSTSTVSMFLEVLKRDPHLIIHETRPTEFAAELFAPC